MALMTLSGVSLAYGHVPLLDHVDFAVEPRERIGLIGRNGTGKSSLLKVVAQRQLPDDGKLVLQTGETVVLVEQEPEFDPGQTVLEAVAQGRSEQAALLIGYERAATDVANEVPGALERLGELQTQLESGDGWVWHNRLESVMQQFGLDSTQDVDRLSGGQKKRVALARAMLAAPSILLLDEPTNHLDFEAIRWLEELLVNESLTVIFITHDRTFLDAVATRIIELDRGRLASYPGNFAAYQKRKADELAAEALDQARFDKLLAQEEVWIRKGVEARRTRNEGRVRRLEALRVERAKRREQVGTVSLAVDTGSKSGKLVAELEGVSKRFGERLIVEDLSLTIMRGDKVGLIGPNGSGKTTLLRIMLGLLPPDSGSVRTGTQLTVAYFDQMREQLDLSQTVMDTISPGSDWVEINGQRKHVVSYLADFLFPAARARSPVSSLSGGERNRLLLARLFARPANVLVLDEPTNDLDIDTLELLEELLEDYPGTVFLVSHDRRFLDAVVTQSIVHEGPGRWREYVGGFSDWQAAVKRQASDTPRAKTVVTPKATAKADSGTQAGQSAAAPSNPVARAPKLNYKEQRELAELPGRIEAAEARQRQITASLADPGSNGVGPADFAKLGEEHARLEVHLAELMTRWEQLQSRADG